MTLNDYFHLTDRPYETFCPSADDYVTPYLAQSVAHLVHLLSDRTRPSRRLTSRGGLAVPYRTGVCIVAGGCDNN